MHMHCRVRGPERLLMSWCVCGNLNHTSYATMCWVQELSYSVWVGFRQARSCELASVAWKFARGSHQYVFLVQDSITHQMQSAYSLYYRALYNPLKSSESRIHSSVDICKQRHAPNNLSGPLRSGSQMNTFIKGYKIKIITRDFLWSPDTRYNSDVSADHGYLLPHVHIKCIHLENTSKAPYI
jgi:hypothetical protein